MKIDGASRITRESLPDAPSGEWIDVLLEHINQSDEQTTQALQQNLTIADNLNASVVTYRMTHGTERTIKNPLKVRPVGVKAIRSVAINGGVRYRVQDIDWRFIDSADAKAPQQLGVTATFAPPRGIVNLTRTTTQAVATTTVSPIQFTSNVTAQSGALSCDVTTTSGTPAVNSKIACAADGIVQVSGHGVFDTSVAGFKGFWVQKNNTDGAKWGYSGLSVTGYFAGAPAALVSVVAGDYLQLAAYQDAAASVNVLDGSSAARFQARYVEPPAGAQCDVVFVVYGG